MALKDQFARPHGLIGHIVGRVMASTNRDLDHWACQAGGVAFGQRVLDVGCGPGVALQASLEVGAARVVGIDPSPVMVAQATARNRGAIADGRCIVRDGDSDRLPADLAPFDRILSVNSFQFWSEPVAALRAMAALLAPEGRLVVVLQPRWVRRAGDVADVALNVRRSMHEAGRSDPEVELRPMRPIPALAVVG
jgi:SAM-dependent methyltransferase